MNLHNYELWKKQVKKVCSGYNITEKEMAKFFRLLTEGARNYEDEVLDDLDSIRSWVYSEKYIRKYIDDNTQH